MEFGTGFRLAKIVLNKFGILNVGPCSDSRGKQTYKSLVPATVEVVVLCGFHATVIGFRYAFGLVGSIPYRRLVGLITLVDNIPTIIVTLTYEASKLMLIFLEGGKIAHRQVRLLCIFGFFPIIGKHLDRFASVCDGLFPKSRSIG